MEKLVRVNVGSIHLFKAIVINSYVEMLISCHMSTDAGTDAMGCVREQECSFTHVMGLLHQ